MKHVKTVEENSLPSAEGRTDPSLLHLFMISSCFALIQCCYKCLFAKFCCYYYYLFWAFCKFLWGENYTWFHAFSFFLFFLSFVLFALELGTCSWENTLPGFMFQWNGARKETVRITMPQNNARVSTTGFLGQDNSMHCIKPVLIFQFLEGEVET